MKPLNVVFFSFVVLFTSACSQVGSAITSTGNYVSKAGSFISGGNGEKAGQSEALKLKTKQLEEAKAKNAKKLKDALQSTTALVKIKTTKKANLRASGKPSRIKITLLQLKSVGKFSNSRIAALSKDSASALGVDFISQESVSILPNSEKLLKFELDPSTRVIGVFGSFNQLNNTIWKTSLNLPKTTGKKFYSFRILVDSKSIIASKN